MNVISNTSKLIKEIPIILLLFFLFLPLMFSAAISTASFYLSYVLFLMTMKASKRIFLG